MIEIEYPRQGTQNIGSVRLCIDMLISEQGSRQPLGLSDDVLFISRSRDPLTSDF